MRHKSLLVLLLIRKGSLYMACKFQSSSLLIPNKEWSTVSVPVESVQNSISIDFLGKD